MGKNNRSTNDQSTNKEKINKKNTQEINLQEQNPLGVEPVGSLIAKFAVPAIVSMLVSAMYNIVDQIFIGQGVGMLGNAATNVAFPVTTIATSLALLLGTAVRRIIIWKGSRAGEKGKRNCRYGVVIIGDQWCDSCCNRAGISEAASDIVWSDDGCYAVCS